MTESVWDKIVKVAAVILTGVTSALGGWDPLLKVLLGCMVADYISGWIVGAIGRSQKSACGGLSSKVGWIGLLKKGLMLLVVLVSTLLDRAIGVEGNMFRDAVCWFYVANEIISINENLKLAGVDFPQRLKGFLGDPRGNKGKGKGKDKSNQ